MLSEVSFRPPLLGTDRLLLRGYEPSDKAAIFEYASDVETAQYMLWERHRTIADAETFLDGFVSENYAAEALDYAICERDRSERVIGGIGVYQRSLSHKTMELGYILHRDFWGRGYVPEAGRALLRRAFQTTDVERIYAPIFEENEKSRRAAEKMGLKFEGIHRSALAIRGSRCSEAVYAIIRDDLTEAAAPTAQ